MKDGGLLSCCSRPRPRTHSCDRKCTSTLFTYVVLALLQWNALSASTVHLKTATLTAGHRRVLHALETAHNVAEWWRETADAQLYILTFHCKATPALQDQYSTALGRQGQLLQYLPENSFLLVATMEGVTTLHRLQHTADVHQYLPEYKIDPQIRELMLRASAWNDVPGQQLLHTPRTGMVTLRAHAAASAGINSTVVQDAMRTLVQQHCTRCWLDFAQSTAALRELPAGNRGAAFVTDEIHVHMKHVEYMARVVSRMPWVHWVDVRPSMQLRNLESAATLQVGVSIKVDGSLSSSAAIPELPFWEAGLTGTGQLIGLADAGLDVNNCFFIDPNQPRPGPNHRKIANYRVIGDETDTQGHGTHVGATLAGKALQAPYNRSNGIAQDARLLFTDMGRAMRGVGTETLQVPSGTFYNIYNVSYSLGARVHSDSWGGRSYDYDADCALVDRFMWENPDFIAVVAAGNDGASTGRRGTIGSPASAKNAISVGATLSSDSRRPPPQGFVFDAMLAAPHTLETIRILAPNGPLVQGRNLSMLQPRTTNSDNAVAPVVSYSVLDLQETVLQALPRPISAVILNGSVPRLLLSEPQNGCVGPGQQLQGRYSSSSNTLVSIQGHVLVIQSSSNGSLANSNDCSVDAKIQAAAASGAVAVLFGVDGSGDGVGFPLPTALTPTRNATVVLPVGGVPHSVLQLIYRMMQGPADGPTGALSPAPVYLVVGDAQAPSSDLRNDVAFFSAFGPTTDGRVKPDILAVGASVQSASIPSLSNNPGAQCAVFNRSGTSMATPSIGGAVAVLRQYFMDGWYPSGTPNPEDSLTPSGMLLKAVLLNGAEEMEGLTEAGLPLEASPSFRQGWGRGSLAGAVPLAPGATFSLWVTDEASINTDQTHWYCLKLPESAPDRQTASNAVNQWTTDERFLQSPISITLTWFDPPAALAAKRTLINDLDLSVVPPPEALGSSKGSAPVPDRLNSVERAVLQYPVAGAQYTITVTGHNVPQPSQGLEGVRYALVVKGPVNTTVCSCVAEPECCQACPGPGAGAPAQQGPVRAPVSQASGPAPGVPSPLAQPSPGPVPGPSRTNAEPSLIPSVGTLAGTPKLAPQRGPSSGPALPFAPSTGVAGR